MSTLSHLEIIGMDVSCDWLDIRCLSDSRQLRLPNTEAGHAELERMALDRTALVCFEAAGGHEWRLWESSVPIFLQFRSGMSRLGFRFDAPRAKTCSTFARSFDLRPLAFAVRAGIGRLCGFLRWIRLCSPCSLSHLSFSAERYPVSPSTSQST